jgi:hypothetical protein
VYPVVSETVSARIGIPPGARVHLEPSFFGVFSAWAGNSTRFDSIRPFPSLCWLGGAFVPVVHCV